MKLVRGMWWPDHQKEAWIHELPVHAGLLAYQRDRLETAVELCERRRVVVDGGAHVGLWTLPLARAFEYVMAFEPLPVNAECLEANVCTEENVTVRRQALADIEGDGLLQGSPSKTIGWSLFRAGSACTSVAKITLDSLNIQDVDLIKLDVEGFEYEALVGAKRTIKRYRPIIVIEEKLDPDYRASALLKQWGMALVKIKKYDRIFKW